MARKVKPSANLTKRRLIKRVLQHNEDVKEIMKSGVRPALQIQEDLKDQLKLVSAPSEAKSKDYLSLSISDNGFLIVDGQELDILHTKDSAHGRLLGYLYEYRREPVARKRLEKLMERPDIIQPLKDLRAQLRKIGLEPKIKSDKRQGTVTFHGIYYK